MLTIDELCAATQNNLKMTDADGNSLFIGVVKEIEGTGIYAKCKVQIIYTKDNVNFPTGTTLVIDMASLKNVTSPEEIALFDDSEANPPSATVSDTQKEAHVPQMFFFTGNFKVTVDEGRYISNINFSNLADNRRMVEETDPKRIKGLEALISYCTEDIKDNTQGYSLRYIFSHASEKDMKKISRLFADFDTSKDDTFIIETFRVNGAPISLRMIDTMFRSDLEDKLNNLVVNRVPQKEAAIKYLENYFKVSNNKNLSPERVRDIFSSPEMDVIFANREIRIPRKVGINSRLAIYFGAPGTGKTYQAMNECKYTMACSVSDTPEDIIKDFKFDAGKPVFMKSALARAMEEGEGIVADEANNWSTEMFEFLQGILDDKDKFDYAGFSIDIKPGFHMVMTMNLAKNGGIKPLPQALVDRAYDIEEFKLNGSHIMRACVGGGLKWGANIRAEKESGKKKRLHREEENYLKNHDLLN